MVDDPVPGTVGPYIVIGRLHGPRTFVEIGRFEPTSQTCSACGHRDGPEPLRVRERTCPACGAPVRPESVPAQREESGSHGPLTRTTAAERNGSG
ncbi:zinc ribbon domain-containing protein [Streptomyces sp. NRRL B-24085]